jgi:hypothetical protein
MGRGIARNLLAAGHHLRVWNRIPGKERELVEAGAERASSPADSVVPGGILVAISDDKAVRAERQAGREQDLPPSVRSQEEQHEVGSPGNPVFEKEIGNMKLHAALCDP